MRSRRVGRTVMDGPHPSANILGPATFPLQRSIRCVHRVGHRHAMHENSSVICLRKRFAVSIEAPMNSNISKEFETNAQRPCYRQGTASSFKADLYRFSDWTQ